MHSLTLVHSGRVCCGANEEFGLTALVKLGTQSVPLYFSQVKHRPDLFVIVMQFCGAAQTTD